MCVEDDCTKQAKADRKLCAMHEMRRYRASRRDAHCTEADCESVPYARGLCSKHYNARNRDEQGRAVSPSDSWRNPKKIARNNLRKALTRGAPHGELIVNADIFDRDGWACQLCARPIDQALTYPHPMSASLDHKQPLSSGGLHVSANVQASHLRCNMSKGNRVS
jgi:hypothetical protein